MLVLARKVGEKIILNDNIEVIVLDANPNSVRIGINAPKNVTVYREELYKEIKNANQTSNQVSVDSVGELFNLVSTNSNAITKTNYENLINKLH